MAGTSNVVAGAVIVVIANSSVGYYDIVVGYSYKVKEAG
jgi:hypothetical protein